MTGDLVPDGVFMTAASDDAPLDVLHPDEWAVVARSTEARQREFATVRQCARQALAEMGEAPHSLLPGDFGSPRWPPGVVGSMTHCAGFRAAAVARASRYAGLGLDAEPNQPLPNDVLEVVARPEEQAWLQAIRARELSMDRLLFSAKETVYKAWFPLTGEHLEFDQASIRFAADGGFVALVFPARPDPTVTGGPVTMRGRWHSTGSLVITALALDHELGLHSPGNPDPQTGAFPGRISRRASIAIDHPDSAGGRWHVLRGTIGNG